MADKVSHQECVHHTSVQQDLDLDLDSAQLCDSGVIVCNFPAWMFASSEVYNMFMYTLTAV